ncbi:MAG: lysostaphin resistance A-like protein [Acidimicrobiales bacterium]
MAQPGDTQPLAGLPTSPVRSTRFLDDPGAPPVSRADGGRWFLYALLGFAVGEVVAYLLVLVAAALAGQGSQLAAISRLAAPPEWYVGVSLVGLWVGFFVGPWLASRQRGTGHLVNDVGLRFRPVDLAGVVIGVGAQFLIDIAYAPFITNPSKFGAPTQRLTGASHGWGFLIIAVMTVVGAPFFEELFFRGLVFRALARGFTPDGMGPTTRRAVGVVAAVAVDGLLFALAHAEWAQFVGLAAFGMLLAAISYRTGRLGMNMVAHASFNLVAVVAVANSRGGLVH